ncbi:MAG TPA: carbonic anhydrase [Solirubrobacterales bacterium]|nr:carbonic anhydrase [Solirubrobacterales bacterium]
MSQSRESRRDFLGTAGGVAAAATLGPAVLAETVAEAAKKGGKKHGPHPKNPAEALALLVKGNRRYQKGKLQLRDYSPVGEDRASKQMPFAAIITCADSRVSPTLIFDVERGNIFVSKVAGNSVDTGTLGSTEYAVAVLGVKVVVVLGHSDCGAVKAAIGVADGTSSYPPDKYGAIGAFVDKIVPSVQGVPPADRTLPNCVQANARAQAADIASRGPIVKQAIATGQIVVVPAVYNIKNGKVVLI